MTYRVEIYDNTGRRTATLAPFGNIESARQAMLDHSGTFELPTEEPFFVPACRVVEGWFVGETEYQIIAN